MPPTVSQPLSTTPTTTPPQPGRLPELPEAIPYLVGNVWYAVERAGAVPDDRPIALTFAGLDLVLFRTATGDLRCFADRCPHRGAQLSAGRLEAGQLRCPFHGWLFAGDGRCQEIPAHPPGTVHPPRCDLQAPLTVVEHADFIWLWWGTANPDHNALPALPDFPSDRWRSVSSAFPWETHFSRVIESTLDNSHAYWVHNSTFATQASPLSEPYGLVKEERHVRASVRYELPVPGWLGTLMKLQGKPAELVAETTFSFYFPNLNIVDTRVGDFMHVIFVHASVPLSASSSSGRWIKYSPRKKGFRPPGTDEKSIEISRSIYAEDHGVVQGQRPMAVPLDFRQESHVASDLLSIEFRKMLKRELEQWQAIAPAQMPN